MKAILFAVASLFVVTALSTQSEARTSHHNQVRSYGVFSHHAASQRAAYRGRRSSDAHTAGYSHHGTRSHYAKTSTRSHYAKGGKSSRYVKSSSHLHYAKGRTGSHYARSGTHSRYVTSSPRSHYATGGTRPRHAKSSTHSRYANRPTRPQSGTRTAHSGVGARPSRWCGWWMRTQKGGGPELNLAANWKHWGRASGPQVGAVVVWSHHVGMITGRTAGGEWIVKSGNDGGAVRERPRSVSGAVFRVG